MMAIKTTVSLLMIFCISQTAFSQNAVCDSTANSLNLKFTYKSLIVPSLLIAYGVIGMESDGLKLINNEVKEEVNENVDKKFTIDDISQYAPFLSVYGLNALGIKGKHNFRERTIIFATSYLIMGSTVYTLKSTSNIERPDDSSLNSFPSGHTATAFAGAEFLWQEYKDVSIWYGIAGYAVATGTGAFRIYNNRHWLTDVAAGAGIGILSTKIAYWVNPYITKTLFKNRNNSNSYGVLCPYYNGQQVGLGLSLNF